ncbi:hypothetical protein IP84_16960 [beta proteobacterium AAP99]|nr:hypothetical protein IP84_16960 [beta proteobacterium AAP99]
MIRIEYPQRLGRGLNDRLHWAARARMAKEQRTRAMRELQVRVSLRANVTLPVTVTLTRIAPSKGVDGDNLQGATKALRDGVADWLGIDDADPRVTWVYAQERGPWGVRIEVQ